MAIRNSVEIRFKAVVMSSRVGVFEFDESGNTLIVRPVSDLGEFEFEHIDLEVNSVLKRLSDTGLRNVEMDFQRCTYFGSSAVGALIRIARAVRTRGGEMVLSNLSKVEREVLEVLHLDDMWTVKSSSPNPGT